MDQFAIQNSTTKQGALKRATGDFVTDLYSLLAEYGGPTQEEVVQMIKDKISNDVSKGERVCVSFGGGFSDIMGSAYSLLIRYGIPTLR